MGEARRRELSVPSQTASLVQVRHAVLELVKDGPFASGQAQLLALAVDEALANVVEHAFARDGSAAAQQIHVLLEAAPDRFLALIRDSGRRFDPTSLPDVDIRRHVRQGRKSGFGIYLIRRIMDEVRYTYTPDRLNELRLVKYADRRARGAQTRQPQRQEGVSQRCP
jgi:anti-sigma regulatory factor (Ser/Thr protein kinase)